MNPRPRPTRAPATGECIDPFDIVTRTPNMTDQIKDDLLRLLTRPVVTLTLMSNPVEVPVVDLMRWASRLRDHDDALADEINQMLFEHIAAVADMLRVAVQDDPAN